MRSHLRNRRCTARLAIAAACASLVVAAVAQGGTFPGHTQADGWIVKFRPGYAQETLSTLSHVAESVEDFGAYDFAVVRDVDAETLANIARWHSGIEYVEPNYLVQAAFVPNDPSYSSQWYLPKIQAPAAWDITRGSSSIVIAIIDTGVDKAHSDLKNKLVAGYDFVNNDADPNDDHGHGTHCAGIAAGITNNRLGIAGVGFNCKIMPVKVLGAGGSGSSASVAAGMRWAAERGARVLSLSLGGSADSQLIRDAAAEAEARGATVVAAAGNSASNIPSYPAAIPSVLAVAATDNQDRQTWYTNFGSWVDVAAPGGAGVGSSASQEIYSTWRGNSYRSIYGTSMACPAVAGIAGLLLSVNSSLQPGQVREAIEGSCDPIGAWIRTGRVNARRALEGIALPAAPSDLVVTGVGARWADLAWRDNSNNETEFRIAISVDGSNWDNLAVLAPNTTTYRANDLQPNRRYWFKVRSANGMGRSDFSNVVSADTPGELPAAPSELRAGNVQPRSLRLTWRDNSNNENEFRVVMSTDGVNFDRIATVAANATSYSVTGLRTNTRYWFMVRAVNAAGKADSNVIEVITPEEIPAAPSHLTSPAKGRRWIDMAWRDNSDNETEFRIAISTNGQDFTHVGTVGANVRQFRVPDLSPNRDYWLRVRAANSAGRSAPANIIRIRTNP